jgi:hypothetical protein
MKTSFYFFLIESQSGQIVQKKLFALAQQSRSQISLSFERHPDIHVNILYLQFGLDNYIAQLQLQYNTSMQFKVLSENVHVY